MANSSEVDKNDGAIFMKFLLASLIVILLLHYTSVILTPKYSRSELQTFRRGLLGDAWQDAHGSRLIFIGKSVYYYGNSTGELPTILLNVNFKDCLIHKKDGSDSSNLHDYLERRLDVRGDKPIILKGDYKIELINPFFDPRAKEIKEDFHVVITWSSIDNLYDFEQPAAPISYRRQLSDRIAGAESSNSSPYAIMDYLFEYMDYKKPVLNEHEWCVDPDLKLPPQFVKSDDAASIFGE